MVNLQALLDAGCDFTDPDEVLELSLLLRGDTAVALKSHDELFEEGNAAYHEGKRLDDNPYTLGTMHRAAWREGWCWGSAHSEDE